MISRSLEIPTCQDLVDTALIRDSRHKVPIILWRKDYLISKLVLIKARSYQDQDSTNLPKLQERISSNLKLEQRASTLSVKLRIGSTCLP
jgi:hypothetical protein